MIGNCFVGGDAEGAQSVDDALGFVLAAAHHDAFGLVLLRARYRLAVSRTARYAILASREVIRVAEVDVGI